MIDSGLTITRVEAFEGPRGMTPEQAYDHLRRYGVLRFEGASTKRRGGFLVQKAFTAENRAVAVCSCITAGAIPDSSEKTGVDRVAAGIRVREEGRLLDQLEIFEAFPKAYGIGEVAGSPVLIESWIEGVPLSGLSTQLGRPGTQNGIGPVDVAVVGVKLYRVLQALSEYGGESGFRGVLPDTVLISIEGDEFFCRIDERDFELRFAVASSVGCDPADILLDMLGARDFTTASHGDGWSTGPIRDERAMLIRLLELGRRQNFEYWAMAQMLQRWIRVHDNQRLNADGSASYAYRLDLRALVPQSQRGECRLSFGSRIVSDALDAAEGDVDWMKGVINEMASAPFRERVYWWFTRNFFAAWVVVMFVYTVVLLAVGWSLYPA